MEITHLDTFGTTQTAVTVMRRGEEPGFTTEELQDGNTIPRLCAAAGKGACEQVCQLNQEPVLERGVVCAERNIANALQEVGVEPENFVLVSATEDNVVFADSANATTHAEGYSLQQKSNAFFFRPGVDKTPNGQPIHAIGMRMADCGSVTISMNDNKGNLILGQAHFSRTNMRGPSAFMHERDGKKVSWAEKLLGDAIEHYGADPKTIRMQVTAAVEGRDFIHHYADQDAMNAHYPGWQELGFMHPEVGKKTDFDCIIDYRNMIGWQLGQVLKEYGLNADASSQYKARNTGNLVLGHASHHWASKGVIEHGRDLYITGISPKIIEEQLESCRTDLEAAGYEYTPGHVMKSLQEKEIRLCKLLGR
jgi:hypothetical protein